MTRRFCFKLEGLSFPGRHRTAGKNARDGLVQASVRRALALCLAAGLSGCVGTIQAQSSPTTKADGPLSEPLVVEYYYKIRWGYQEEFWDLFLKNHLPLLRRQQERGELGEIRLESPRDHMTEDARWDFRVTIAYKTLSAYFDGIPDTDRRELYPDQETFKQEERRRFELILAHWDLPVVKVKKDR